MRKNTIMLTLSFVAAFALLFGATPSQAQVSGTSVAVAGPITPVPLCLCSITQNIITGTNAGETLDGTSASDCINLKGGDDTSNAQAGN
ncbi:MAG: hypothetical protein AAF657_38070, partial [Acidobacteriota bacterium]